jgi:hypothetical protein
MSDLNCLMDERMMRLQKHSIRLGDNQKGGLHHCPLRNELE